MTTGGKVLVSAAWLRPGPWRGDGQKARKLAAAESLAAGSCARGCCGHVLLGWKGTKAVHVDGRGGLPWLERAREKVTGSWAGSAPGAADADMKELRRGPGRGAVLEAIPSLAPHPTSGCPIHTLSPRQVQLLVKISGSLSKGLRVPPGLTPYLLPLGPLEATGRRPVPGHPGSKVTFLIVLWGYSNRVIPGRWLMNNRISFSDFQRLEV